MTTYKNIPSLIKNRTEYTHGSSHAVWDGEVYKVYSYTTLIFSYEGGKYPTIIYDDKYYSHTTSRLQNIIKNAYQLS